MFLEVQKMGKSYKMVVVENNGKRYTVRNTKGLRQAYEKYESSDYYYLHQIYNSWSDAKEEVFNEWKGKVNDLKIISFNPNMFTLGGYVTIDNIDYFVYITPRKNEALEIEVLKAKKYKEENKAEA